MEEILTEEQLFVLHRAFSSVDHNNNGLVHIKDIPIIYKHLDQSCKSFIIEENELKGFIEQIDTDDSGRITFTQFLTLTAYKINTSDTIEELQEAFRLFDRKNSGFIHFDDLWRVMESLGENVTKSDIEQMMREADRDLDGKISFPEFVEMVRYPQIKNSDDNINLL